jgi:hypothetical protein
MYNVYKYNLINNYNDVTIHEQRIINFSGSKNIKIFEVA